MRRVVALVLVALSLSACKGDSRSTLKSEPGSKEKVTLVERAAASDADLEEIRSELQDLRDAIEALGASIPDDTSDASRLRTLEQQVGVNSIHRNSITNLWNEIDRLETEIERLESCVQRMRQNWGSTSAPYC